MSKERKSLAERTGLSPHCLLRVANFADKMRIKGIGEEYVELLEAAGIDTVRELKYRNPANLARIAEVNTRLKLVRALHPRKSSCVGSRRRRSCRSRSAIDGRCGLNAGFSCWKPRRGS